jgi:hypothetical protein
VFSFCSVDRDLILRLDIRLAPRQITRNYGNQHGVCERVSATLPRNGCHLGLFHSLAIIGLQGFFPLKGQAAMGVGALEVPPSERKRLAAL